MKHRVLHDAPIAQMFNDDPLEQWRRDAGVPDAFGIHDDDRAAGADAETRGFASLYPPWAEQQAFPLEQGREEAVEFPARLIW